MVDMARAVRPDQLEQSMVKSPSFMHTIAGTFDFLLICMPIRFGCMDHLCE